MAAQTSDEVDQMPSGRGAAQAVIFNRRLARGLVAGVAALLLVLWGLFAWSTSQQFDMARDTARAGTATLTKLVEAWAHSTLLRLDYLVVSIETQLGSDQLGDELDTLLARQQAADPELFIVIEVRDALGRMLATSDPTFPLDSARNFETDTTRVVRSHIGLPRAVNGRVLIPVRHPVLTTDGREVGSIFIEIDPNYFAGFSENLGLPDGASVVLLRTDGPLLARNARALGKLGGSYRESPLWTALSERPEGDFEATEADGVRRIVSYRTSSDFPLAVSIGYAAARVYTEAQRRMIHGGLIAASLSLLIVAATVLLLLQLGRRAAAEAAAEIARAAMQSVGSGVAVVVADEDRRITLVNPAFGRLLGFASGRIEGRRLSDVAGNQAVRLFALCDWPRTPGAETVREVTYRHPEGRDLWLEIRIAQIPDQWGLVRHAVMVVSDISERKRTERELVQARDAAEASSRAKSEFLANMSHELRTPMNAIIGFAEIIAGEMFGPVGTPRYRDYADSIRRSGAHLLAIIADILDLAKIEADRIVLDQDVIAVPEMLAMCATLVAGRAAQAQVRVRIEPAPGLPALVADELRVKQIVLNLLSNAVKFSPNGAEVVVSAVVREDAGIEIAVADHGCGMTAEELKLAVEPFRQVNGMIAKRNEGTGLGLSLALRLTTLHGGALVIDSVPGVGTVARARFPATRNASLRAAA
ncbi:MAG: ATP-binding protein [Alphaproteobacteria bacterium]